MVAYQISPPESWETQLGNILGHPYGVAPNWLSDDSQMGHHRLALRWVTQDWLPDWFPVGSHQIGSKIGAPDSPPDGAEQIGSQMGCTRLAIRYRSSRLAFKIGSQMGCPRLNFPMGTPLIGSQMGHSRLTTTVECLILAPKWATPDWLPD